MQGATESYARAALRLPPDLLDAQASLNAAQAAYEQYIQSPDPDSEQRDSEFARYRAELLRLSIEVVLHPFWSTLEQGTVVAARTALKHAHDGQQP
ncbi:hypothetical protein AB0891_33300 [Streptomyces sp. NPDC007259]|uniref:hypothetical protein n=1 Tax=Streptomyces sp. NPDC007259 TaxID=3154319 RepID=UPI0034538995